MTASDELLRRIEQDPSLAAALVWPAEFDIARRDPVEDVVLPTGMPLVYELDDELKPIRSYYLGDPENMKQIYPDYVAMAKSFNVPGERVMFRHDLRAALQRMLDSNEPYVLDVITPYTEHVIPFIPAGKTVADMIY